MLGLMNFIVVFSGDKEDLIYFLGAITGPGFFALMYARYRNANKSHNFEHETKVEVKNLKTHDLLVGNRKKLSDDKIKGVNSNNDRERL